MSSKAPEQIWSNTDYPYQCLKDVPRTLALKKAIENSVKAGDIVVDIGAGSGILAFFAASAGATKVYCVEIDHALAEALRQSISMNGFDDIITVVESDIMFAELPKNVNVVVAEIIETALIDEMQLPVMNKLISDGVIGDNTIVLPSGYETYIDLVHMDDRYYGYRIAAPKHEWPFFLTGESAGWCKNSVYPVSEKHMVCDLSLSLENEQNISGEIIFQFATPQSFNHIRLSGIMTFPQEVRLGAFNALNGDKIYFLGDYANVVSAKLNISYIMGAGAKSLTYTLTDVVNG